jgi:hypothetical protein
MRRSSLLVAAGAGESAGDGPSSVTAGAAPLVQETETGLSLSGYVLIVQLGTTTTLTER